MELKTMNLKQLYAKAAGIRKTSTRVNLGLLFSEKIGWYLNEYSLFLAHFNSIPNIFHEKEIDCKKANKWFVENYKREIKDFHFSKRHFNQSEKVEYDGLFYILYDDLIIKFDTNLSLLKLLFRKTDISKVEKIVVELKKFKEKKVWTKPEIFLLVNTKFGLDTKSLNISRSRLRIEDNYNSDFREIHETILKRLSKKNDKGLVLLHGKPGTGKTSYIRYLVSILKKKVIFLPPNMASAITNPDLISVLIENTNCIFVIEDAENIVIDRERNGQSPVSALLNISDGLLSDCLNIQIICSFNTDITKIDTALMRKGRLIAKYEFKELEVEKAQKLSRKLGFDVIINSPMTLTEIYHQDEKNFQQTKRFNQIGFRAGALN
ncbi:MAG TPA: AAA family ATPase [Hanamia sp.]|nr:AAA family ATPase [Hanamia sp.]